MNFETNFSWSTEKSPSGDTKSIFNKLKKKTSIFNTADLRQFWTKP